MNKANRILILLALLFAILVTVAGCHDAPDNKSTVVVAIERRQDDQCFYTVRDGNGYGSGFINDCGLFNVGDRVQYQKVQP